MQVYFGAGFICEYQGIHNTIYEQSQLGERKASACNRLQHIRPICNCCIKIQKCKPMHFAMQLTRPVRGKSGTCYSRQNYKDLYLIIIAPATADRPDDPFCRLTPIPHDGGSPGASSLLAGEFNVARFQPLASSRGNRLVV